MSDDGRCPTCGGPVKVTGRTTKYYVPVPPPASWRAEIFEDGEWSLIGPKEISVALGAQYPKAKAIKAYCAPPPAVARLVAAAQNAVGELGMNGSLDDLQAALAPFEEKP